MACVLISGNVQPPPTRGDLKWNDPFPPAEAQKLLGPLFWNIMLQRGITPEEFSQLLEEYDRKLRSQGRGSRHRNLKGDLEVQLRREDMTWKIFCMGLEAIGAKSLDLEVNVHF